MSRRWLQKLTIFAAPLLAGLIACAPPPERLELSEAPQPGGPALEDITLDLDSPSFGKNATLFWAGEFSPAAVLRVSENLRALRIAQEDPTFRAKLGNLSKGLVESLPRDRTTLANSAYAQALADESEAVARSTLDELLKTLASDRSTIRRQLQSRDLGIETSSPPRLESAIEAAHAYVTNFEKRIPRMNLHPTLARKLAKELALERERLIGDARRALQDFVDQKTIHGRLAVVRRVLQAHRQPMKPDDEIEAREAEALSREIESFQGTAGALKLLVGLWRKASAEDREALFRPASPELYDYLRSQDAKDLSCLENPSCQNLFTSLAKTFVIYPELEKYGLEKLRSELRAKGLQMLTERVRASVAILLKGLPQLIETSIFQKLDPQLSQLKRFRDDFLGGIKGRLDTWTTSKLGLRKDTVFSISPAVARVRLKGDSLAVSWRPEESVSAPESAGAFASWLHLAWLDRSLPRAHELSTALSQVEYVTRAHQISLREPTKQAGVSARARAEVIRGLSRLILSFRDWETAPLDYILGAHTAQELFPEVKVEDLEVPLFPKDALMAMAVSGVADQLSAITRPGTTVFMVDLDRRVTWADQFDFSAPATPSVMAGVVDRRGAEVVRVEDLARYLLALCEFLEATRNISQTKSKHLLNVDAKLGEAPLARLTKGRDQVRLLVMALANYLSHQFRSPERLLHPALSLTEHRPTGEAFRVLDQVLAIRALLESAQALGVEVYRWEAQDIYFAMNRELFREELAFYGSSQELSLPVLLEGLRALELLEGSLSGPSAEQLRRLNSFWSERLRHVPFGTISGAL